VADDTEDIRIMIRVMLENKGHRVVETAHGREAVELATRERPDVILMDLQKVLRRSISILRRPQLSCPGHDDSITWIQQ
jgi:CheY-like chemotaxis protein